MDILPFKIAVTLFWLTYFGACWIWPAVRAVRQVDLTVKGVLAFVPVYAGYVARFHWYALVMIVGGAVTLTLAFVLINTLLPL